MVIGIRRRLAEPIVLNPESLKLAKIVLHAIHGGYGVGSTKVSVFQSGLTGVVLALHKVHERIRDLPHRSSRYVKLLVVLTCEGVRPTQLVEVRQHYVVVVNYNPQRSRGDLIQVERQRERHNSFVRVGRRGVADSTRGGGPKSDRILR